MNFLLAIFKLIKKHFLDAFITWIIEKEMEYLIGPYYDYLRDHLYSGIRSLFLLLKANIVVYERTCYNENSEENFIYEVLYNVNSLFV